MRSEAAPDGPGAALEVELSEALLGRLGARPDLVAERLATLAGELRRSPREDGLAFLDLPFDDGCLREAEAWRRGLDPYDTVVLCGTGGSALPAMVVRALAPGPPAEAELERVDTPDPVLLSGSRSRERPSRRLRPS
jgi:hypothetical protein